FTSRALHDAFWSPEGLEGRPQHRVIRRRRCGLRALTDAAHAHVDAQRARQVALELWPLAILPHAAREVVGERDRDRAALDADGLGVKELSRFRDAAIARVLDDRRPRAEHVIDGDG